MLAITVECITLLEKYLIIYEQRFSLIKNISAIFWSVGFVAAAWSLWLKCISTNFVAKYLSVTIGTMISSEKFSFF